MLTPEQKAKLKVGLSAMTTTKNDHITINVKECLECGACVDECPMGALAIGDGRVNISSECVGCMTCIAICPVNAIKAL